MNSRRLIQMISRADQGSLSRSAEPDHDCCCSRLVLIFAFGAEPAAGTLGNCQFTQMVWAR